MARTDISPRVKGVLLLVFLALILTPLVGELGRYVAADETSGWPLSLEIFPRVQDAVRAHEAGRESMFGRFLALNRRLLNAIKRYEDRLRHDSWLPQALRPPVQALMVSCFRHAGEEAYVGHDGWLYYRADVDSVCGKGFLDKGQLRKRASSGSETVEAPQPDPRPAILELQRQLAERGIRLIVMPTPVKPVIHARELAGTRSRIAPVHNVSFDSLMQDLREAGVSVFDPTDLLLQIVNQGTPAYLRTDTHWRPDAVEAVARELAARIENLLPPSDGTETAFRTEERTITQRGDIAGLLGLDKEAVERLIPEETVTVKEIHDDYGGLWQPRRDAAVLVLGDSFTNIYSLDQLGWGRSAGLAEQLSFRLGRPVDRIAQNDGGAVATRRILARELAAGRDRLATKKVVVWEFASREFAFGNWALVPLALGDRPESHFLVPDPGTTREVTGTIAQVSSVPEPGSVPYRDHLCAIHLLNVSVDGKPAAGTDVVAYVRSMRDNVWTAAATLRVGDRANLLLRPWEDAPPEFDRINRTELEDVNLQLQEHAWAEFQSDRTQASSPELSGGGWSAAAALALVLLCLLSRIRHSLARSR